MPKPKIQLKLEASFTLELNEQEIGALDAIFGYNVDSFLFAFKKNMGAAYVEKYEAGVRSLSHRLRSVTTPALREIQQVRDRVNSALREQ